MKTPRIEDFDPKAERPLATPLEGMPVIVEPRAPAVKLPSPVTEEKQKRLGALGKQPSNPLPSLNGQQAKTEKFEKYSTYLRPGYKKKIQQAALDVDCEDYEVVDEALTQYFTSLKK